MSVYNKTMRRYFQQIPKDTSAHTGKPGFSSLPDSSCSNSMQLRYSCLPAMRHTQLFQASCYFTFKPQQHYSLSSNAGWNLSPSQLPRRTRLSLCRAGTPGESSLPSRWQGGCLHLRGLGLCFLTGDTDKCLFKSLHTEMLHHNVLLPGNSFHSKLFFLHPGMPRVNY